MAHMQAGLQADGPTTTAPCFSMVAGEPSGDLLGGLLLQGLQTRWPGLQAAGIGGPCMRAAGFRADWPSDTLAVRGYVEVLRHYIGIVRIRRQLLKKLLQQPPQLFVGIDAPDFNLTLEARLRLAGIKTVHFICPSIWAWRPERIEKIKRSVDHVLCIFPFEPALLAEHGIAATYVGHPLAQVIPVHTNQAQARAQLGLEPHGQVVAVLPGSRHAEIDYLAQHFFQAVALIKKAKPATKFIVPAMPALRQKIQQAALAAGVAEHMRVFEGQSHAVLAACDVALVASGTATLEAALFKRPMVIAYNMHELSWRWMRRKQMQPWVGLPNILCGEAVVPEFLQKNADAASLAQAVLQWLDAPSQAPEKIPALVEKFTVLHLQLKQNTFALACDAIEKTLAL